MKPEYHARAVALAKDIHVAYVRPGVGVHWKMAEDLSGPYPVCIAMLQTAYLVDTPHDTGSYQAARVDGTSL